MLTEKKKSSEEDLEHVAHLEKKSWKNNGKLIHLEEIDNRIYIAYLVTTVDSQSFSVHEPCHETVLVEGWRRWDAYIPHMEVTGCCLLYRCQPHHLLGKESSNSRTVSQNMQADHCKLGWYAGKRHWVWMIRAENQTSSVMSIISLGWLYSTQKGSMQSGILFGKKQWRGYIWKAVGWYLFFSSVYPRDGYADRGHSCITYLIRRRNEIKRNNYDRREMIRNGEEKGKVGEFNR